MRLSMRTRLLGPIGKTWTVEICDVQPGRQFRDRQIHGPFAEWVHTHRLTPTADGYCLLDDEIHYRLPFGLLGQLIAGRWVQTRLERLFHYRHAVIASDLRRYLPFQSHPRWTIAVTGSTGLVGSQLCQFLAAGGHRVRRLVRQEPRNTRGAPSEDGTTFQLWDPHSPLSPTVLAGVDAIVHLAGESVAAGRWTAEKKRRIRESRVGPTTRLAEAAAVAGVKVFLSASGIGIYGDRGDERLTEDSQLGSGFLADVCRDWEAACEPAAQAGIRTVQLRIGMVLSARGGALAAQLPAFRFGAGGVLGSGTQWVSWISIQDLIGVIHHALMDDTLSGPINAVAPHPITNREWGRLLAQVLRRPYLLTVPAGVLRLLLGEMADELILASQQVTSNRLPRVGFSFDHPHAVSALRFLLGQGY
ncbi:MAG: TIGR01777 family oxidoreductase, partial [Bacteroidales bacterium]|nr:TIGR01777 family oxidoreductase [Bacteroidales bacterium]